MKIDFDKFIISGYIILLLVNSFEIRSGFILSSFQLFLGLLVFLPKLFKGISMSSKMSFFIELLFVGSLLSGVYVQYFSLPNHYFVFCAITFIFLLYKKTNNLTLIRNNMHWLFVILMGFATLYKVLEPNFINGGFVGYMLSKGGFFHHILGSDLLPEMKSIILENSSKIIALEKTDPTLANSIVLDIELLPFRALIKGFTFLIIAGELILTLLFAIIPYKKITLLFLLVFVCSIIFVTVELEFISTLLFIGFVICPSELNLLKKGYIFFFLFFAFMAITYNVYHLF